MMYGLESSSTALTWLHTWLAYNVYIHVHVHVCVCHYMSNILIYYVHVHVCVSIHATGLPVFLFSSTFCLLGLSNTLPLCFHLRF